ncbi:MBL fold metallo-hydrolase [Streptomyces sp. SID4956]|uniref:MBL fold metallo-hydrolase n=1 Tax=Streptomyces sp. SID4956 TaxID=2690290 RepID=UPI001370E1F9|nr:MBL fold metallo-hydrolase [Streptomyces sp. SID4956]
MTAGTTGRGGTGISILGTAQHTAWQERVLPPVERLTGGMWSVPVPIPDNPLRYTLCYLVPGDGGLVVVDPGWDTDAGWDALLAGLRAAGAALSDVSGIVAMHVHPDHHGLSERLREQSGAWIAMHPAERDSLPQRAGLAQPGARRESLRRGLRRWGVPEEAVKDLLSPFDERSADHRPFTMAEPDVLLEDGDAVPLPGRRLHAVWTPGHTPGHLCLREPDAGLLLTGDHVLPRITPNIGLSRAPDDAPLTRFLESLERTAAFDDHDALPAHEYRFRGLAARTRQLRDHHEQRCRELLTVIDGLGSPTVWQVAERLSWSRPWAEVGQMRIGALAETEAHIRHLADQGELDFTTPAPTRDADPSADVPAVRVRPAARTAH